MSEIDYVEPSSDSFWEIGQYKRTVRRCEDGNKLCTDMMQMISERADLEKAYSKSLKAWSKKWNEYLQKGSEYGTMKQTWQSSLTEADKLAEIHLATHNVLNDELNREIKEWQKQSYPKSIVNTLKTPKEYEEEFKKAQKPWSKKYSVVEKTKKDYHSACKSYQSAKIQSANSQNDQAISPDQKKKLEDKVEKYKKECEITKNKYKQALDDLNSYNSRYIEDMNNVYKKCDAFEKERLEFFIQKFIKLHNHLNIFEKMNIEEIYAEFLRTVKQTNPDRDLLNWSKEFGSNMPMNWPLFEEYSEELKQITKGKKPLSENNGGVTMTSIKHKTDEYNNDGDTRSISIGGGGNDNQRYNRTSAAASEDPWADSPSFSSQRSNEFANSFEDYSNNQNWYSAISVQEASTSQKRKKNKSLIRSVSGRLSKNFTKLTKRMNSNKSSQRSIESNNNLNIESTSKNGTIQKSDIKILTNGSGSLKSAVRASTMNTASTSSIGANLNGGKTTTTTNQQKELKSEISYPKEQNPFGDDNDYDDDFSDEDNPKPVDKTTHLNITSTNINPSVPLNKGSTSSPLSIKTTTTTTNLTTTTITTSVAPSPPPKTTTPTTNKSSQILNGEQSNKITSSKLAPNINGNKDENEYENLNKIPLVLYDNINPDLNLKHLASNYDNPVSLIIKNEDDIYQNLNQDYHKKNTDRTSTSNPHSNNSKDSNPFGEYDDDDENTNAAAANQMNGKSQTATVTSNPHYVNDDSDEDNQKTSYLSIQVKALYDYQSAEDDELSFKAGEEFIKLANEDERGWCLGKIGNKVGLYPATYATEI